MRGRISKRGNSWRLVLDAGTNPETGRRQQHSETFRLKTDAERRLVELVGQVNEGSFSKPSKLTVGEWLRQWQTTYVASALRATTARKYDSYMRVHAIPSIGRIRLGNLRPDHIKQLHTDARARGLGRQSVQHLHRIFSKALHDAEVAGHVIRNVAPPVKPPKLDPNPKAPYRPEVITAFIREARTTRYGEPLLLDLFLGLRRSELLGLQWQDVDLGQNRVSVCRSLHHLPSHGFVVYPTKNQTSARELALSESASLIFRGIRDRREAEAASLGVSIEPDGFVFADALGTPLSPNALSMATRRIANRIGLAGVRLHDIRHWAASLALANGATLQEVQQFLGHSTIRVTADIYGHLEDRARAVQADRMEIGIRSLLESPNPVLP